MMKPGFILLEAIIAMLIISMVCLSALECVRLMNASVERFSANHAAVQARRNAVALIRHLAHSSKLKSGSVAYGTYLVRWQAESIASATPQPHQMVAPVGDVSVSIYRVTIITENAGQQVDQSVVILTSQAK